MNDRSYVSVEEAAQELGVAPQRVRAMVGAGRLPARRFGRAWAISRRDLSGAQQRKNGRPLSAANAWGLLALLDESRPDWIDAAVRSRLKKRLGERSWVEAALRHSEPRSLIYQWRVLVPDLQRIARAFPLVRSGLSANDRGIDVVQTSQVLDAYVEGRSVQPIRRMAHPLEEPEEANLVLRVPSEPWIFSYKGRAPSSVVAADLLDHGDPRVSRAARRLLKHLPR